MYSQKFKEKVLRRYDETHKVRDTCREFHIGRETFRRWRKSGQGLDEERRVRFCSQKKLTVRQGEKEKLLAEYEILHAEYEILRFAYEYFTPTLKEKLEIADRLKGKYKTKQMCRVIGVNHSTFYNHDRRGVEVTKNQKRNAELKILIAETHKKSDERFGANKVYQKLKADGVACTLKKVSALMKEMGLSSKRRTTSSISPKKKKGTPIYFYPGNLLKQNFNQPAPNVFWAGDVTEYKIRSNTYYICVVMDLFSRKIIACRVGLRNNNSLTINTFKDAFEGRNKPRGVSFHSDQGSNYTSNEYKSLLWELKVRQSFSKRGTPYDNSAVEGFFSNMKQDDLYTRQFQFFHELVLAVNKYIEYYNSYRPHQHLNFKTPNQVEAEYVPETFEDEDAPF